MKIADVLQELETVAEKKSVRVSYENMAGELGSGGLCKVKGEYRIIIDRRATDGDKVTVLASALGQFPLEDVFMSEHTRTLIERQSGRSRKVAAAPIEPSVDPSATESALEAPLAE